MDASYAAVMFFNLTNANTLSTAAAAAADGGGECKSPKMSGQFGSRDDATSNTLKHARSMLWSGVCGLAAAAAEAAAAEEAAAAKEVAAVAKAGAGEGDGAGLTLKNLSSKEVFSST
jgi:hypothetical protein